MKYRLVKRAKGWCVQIFPLIFIRNGVEVHEWGTLRVWRFRLFAALHLLWLRERARK
jgi:hypothetical protein